MEQFGNLDSNTKHYPIKKLSEIADYWNGLTYKPTDAVQDGTGILVLRSSNIQNGALSFDDNVRVTCPIKEKLFVKENDILLCSRNGSAALVGKTALIKGLTEPMTFGAFMMIIRSSYYPFLKTYFEMPVFRKQISTGTSTINQITGKMLNDISLQWDGIERELHNESLWFFLTNSVKGEYQTRIDLVLDLIAGKDESTREKYYTFFRFDELRKEVSLDDIWKKIYQTFLTLKGWYEDHDLYHRIGYLITSGTFLHKIFALSKDKKKSEFNESLDELIKKSVAISGNYAELSYEKPLDYKRISTLLLLFNIESVRRSDGHAQRFPFDQFKHHKGSNVTWSLEHIHAQQSEGMKTQDVWKKWLELHIPSVESIGGEHSELIDEMQGAINADKLERTVFESIQQKVLGLLSVSGNTEYMHSIANLALLNTADNAALNNSTFDVKRNDIIQMDKRGQYIPFCTKMVFLKYYTPSAENQLHFWGQADRIAYIKAISDVLSDYIEPIVLEKEETK